MMRQIKQAEMVKVCEHYTSNYTLHVNIQNKNVKPKTKTKNNQYA